MSPSKLSLTEEHFIPSNARSSYWDNHFFIHDTYNYKLDKCALLQEKSRSHSTNMRNIKNSDTSKRNIMEKKLLIEIKHCIKRCESNVISLVFMHLDKSIVVDEIYSNNGLLKEKEEDQRILNLIRWYKQRRFINHLTLMMVIINL